MDRRQFLRWGSLGVCSSAVPNLLGAIGSGAFRPGLQSAGSRAPAFSVIPVVGDGHWIWKQPPAGETGYLEPRPYRLDVGIELEATGDTTDLRATTPVPVAHPEQKIEDLQIETQGCEAVVRELAPGAAQLFLSAAGLAKGEVASAVAHYKLTLLKQYQAYQRDQFPARQKPPADDPQSLFARQSWHSNRRARRASTGQAVDRRCCPPLGHGPAVCRVDS